MNIYKQEDGKSFLVVDQAELHQIRPINQGEDYACEYLFDVEILVNVNLEPVQDSVLFSLLKRIYQGDTALWACGKLVAQEETRERGVRND